MSLKNISKSIFEYIFVFCIVINAGSQYVHMTLPYINLILFILLLFSGVGIIFSSKIKMNKISKASRIILFLIAYFFIYFIFQKVGRLELVENVVIVLIIFSVMYLCYTKDNPKLLFLYRDIVTVIAVISILFWLFGSILQIIKPTGTVMTSWTGQNDVRSIPSYFGIYFETQSTKFTGWNIGNFVRNSAIYAESPIASLNFCLALAINLFIEKKPSKIKNIILILAILSTTSGTGFIILLICLLGRILLSDRNYKLINYIKILGLPMLLIITFIVSIAIFKQKMIVNSGNLRIDDFIAGFKAWLANPLWGSGIGNATILFQNMSLSRIIQSQLGISNSVALILSEGGLYIALLYILCFIISSIKSLKYKKYNYLMFYLIFIILLSSNPVPFMYLTFMVLIWMLQ